jgi:hypothetical protein
MVQPAVPGIPGGDNPRRKHKGYSDKWGLNPMKSSYDNCFIKTRLGVDPVTGKPISVWEEQINREKQILESVGEQCLFFRYDVTPDKNIDGGRRCPLCWDERRHQARYNCALCNSSGVITNDPNITRIQGYEWIKNPDLPNGMFWTHLNMTPQKFESKDIGFMATHASNFWTVPIRNGAGNIVNYLQNRDVFVRFIFDPNTHKPIRELERRIITNMNYSVGPENQLLHMQWESEVANPGVDSKIFGLPNFLN